MNTEWNEIKYTPEQARQLSEAGKALNLARNLKLSKERKKEIARGAIKKRWEIYRNNNKQNDKL